MLACGPFSTVAMLSGAWDALARLQYVSAPYTVQDLGIGFLIVVRAHGGTGASADISTLVGQFSEYTATDRPWPGLGSVRPGV